MKKVDCRNVLNITTFICLAVIFCLWCYLKMNPGIYDGFAEPGKAVSIHRPGRLQLQYNISRAPSQKAAVEVAAPALVVPGGQSIGIVMHSKGIMVVGMSDIMDEWGKRSNPAEEAGIKVGDLILTANGKKIDNTHQLRSEIGACGINQKNVEFEIKRGSKIIKTSIKTVLCKETGRPRIGLFVRDTASGVGTISFYHPETGTYGALGHMITDVDTAMGIDLSRGKITEASVRGIQRGIKGRPGEKIGMFVEGGNLSGNIEKNTRYGIFGCLQRPLENPLYANPVPVAPSLQVRKGPAEMLTVIDGTEVRKYSVEIQEVFYPWNSHGGKGMIIKIEDRELIDSAGGIIQGMSGSPIIQDGMLAGVLTHVFINDPIRGYGVPAEWMIREAGLLNYDKKMQKAS